MIKAIHIGRNLNSFLNEHPEIKIFKSNNKIKFILLSENVQIVSLFVIDDCVYDLQFFYNDNFYHFAEN